MTTGGVAEVLKDAGMADAARLVSAPSEEFLLAHRDLVGRGRTLFQQLHANGTPALALIRNGMPHLIGSNALYGSYNNLLAQIQAA
ncbi:MULTISPECIES: hypothetical protein [Mesorhizobium]|uniref:hypothetical protein n=1 Tax=Mesorhizobium TaxID=68287 RepID=UPI001FEA19C1|nr:MULTISPECIES: hypothetical protein [Mesorhizobium]